MHDLDAPRREEEEAYATFCQLRWPETNGQPICPYCGCLDVYEITTRQRFKCAGCRRQFSVTSGTIFAWCKMGFARVLAVIDVALLTDNKVSVSHLARVLDCEHKTARLLLSKAKSFAVSGLKRS